MVSLACTVLDAGMGPHCVVPVFVDTWLKVAEEELVFP